MDPAIRFTICSCLLACGGTTSAPAAAPPPAVEAEAEPDTAPADPAEAFASRLAEANVLELTYEARIIDDGEGGELEGRIVIAPDGACTVRYPGELDGRPWSEQITSDGARLQGSMPMEMKRKRSS